MADRAFLPEETRETTLGMTDRQNTIVCAFTHSSPRIRAHEIHDWIYDTLQLPESDIRMIQIDCPRRHVLVYIKFHTSDRTYSLLLAPKGCVEFRHDSGVIDGTCRLSWHGRKAHSTGQPAT
jgi:hypothetical protein